MREDPRRFLLVTTVKDEGPSIVEWVAHHRNIGFTDIVVYQNGSTDGTQKLLRTMARHGYIKYFPNDSKRGLWQNRAYRRASFLDDYQQADWVMVLDGDEFLSINVGDGKVADLVDAVPKSATAVHINWKLFGSSDRKTTSDSLVTEDFLWCESKERIADKLVGFKAIFKPSVYVRPGIHKPKVVREGKVEKIYNGSGMREGKYETKIWRSKDPKMRKLAQVNHYVIRDAQRFMIKSVRGRTHEDRAISTDYWRGYDWHDEMDITLAKKSAQTRITMKMMDVECNERLSLLTAHARRIQKERFDALMTQEKHRIVFSEITGDPAPPMVAKPATDEKEPDDPENMPAPDESAPEEPVAQG